MSAHTPGPWRFIPVGCYLDTDGNPTNTPIEFQIIPIMGTLVVGNVSADRRAADARLIAAAPDLLEVARLLSILTEEGDDRMHGAYSRDGVIRAKGSTLDLIEKARAAIAKATGEAA